MKKQTLKQQLGRLIVLTMILGMVSMAATYAVSVEKTSTVTLSKEDALLMALSNSSEVRNLEKSLVDLNKAYLQMKDGIKSRYSLHTQLPRYQTLYLKNQVTQANATYKTYLELQVQKPVDVARLPVVNAELAILSAIAVGDRTPEQASRFDTLTAEAAAINGRLTNLTNLEATLTASEKAQIITVAEYNELQGLAAQFAPVGIVSPILTSQQEFEAFIKPLYITPHTMETDIQTLALTLESEKTRLKLSTTQQYVSVLEGYGNQKLQLAHYLIIKKNLYAVNKKYELQLATAYDLEKAQGAYDIATLEKTATQRNIDNSEMALKKLLGLDLTVNIKLLDGLETNLKPASLEDYLQGARQLRNELKTAQLNLDDKANQMDWTKRYFASTSDTYGILENELSMDELSFEALKGAIDQEIRNAYADIGSKEDLMKLNLKDFEHAKGIFHNMQRYLALGYVTEATVNAFEQEALNKELSFFTAQRGFYNACAAIEAASDIGPGYNTIGGMGN